MQLIQKGQSLQLKPKTGVNLTIVAVGLGWGKKEKKGFFGGMKKVGVDLDASCIMYDNNRNALDTVWFGNLKSSDGSIVHTGDDLVGGGDEQDPNEVINVDLNRVPANVKSIVFVVNSYSGETFEGVPFAFCNVVDNSNGSEMARYNLQTDGRDYKGFVISKIERVNEGWIFNAIGEKCTGRQKTVEDIEPQAKQYA